MEPAENKNGNGHTKKMAPPFKLERTLLGVAEACMEIAHRVMNQELNPNEAREATRALMGVPAVMKVQLQAIELFETGGQRVKEEAAKILGIAAPALSDQSKQSK